MKAFFTCISIAIWVSWLNQGFSQCGTPFKVLHYTETSGYDHRTRNESLSMFQNLGTSNNFSVVNDNTGATFNSLTDLQAYQVIIFSNTSGNTILTAAQRANFEAYMESGGGFVGLHAASDTYRHSSADGTPKGGWDWFAEMLGASVQYTPTPHTANNHLGEMDHVLPCHATKHLPDPWSKREEYYYWQRGFYDFGKNNVLLQVRRTGGQTYDADRPISWFKHLPGGGRAFYTALGHNKSDYTTPGNEFSKHVLAGLLWTADPTPIEVSEFNGVDVPGVWVRQPGKLYSAGNNTFPYTVSNDKLYMANYRGGANN
ncbi:MAG: ThuA domain-containing protein, partial [Bacteroidota bacterium]